MTEIESKHGIVSRQPYEMYMSFVDLQNFQRMLPEDKRDMITVPYSRIELVDFDAPFAFHIVLHFEPAREDPYKTDFWINVEADLNLMMKMMLSGKVKDALDKVVDGLVDASNGKMPEGFDPSQWAR